MVTSVNTNVGAMVALQNLNQTSTQLMTVQNEINTGLKVSSPKDNGGVFAIAQNMRADVGSLDAVNQSLDRASSMVDVAVSAGTRNFGHSDRDEGKGRRGFWTCPWIRRAVMR